MPAPSAISTVFHFHHFPIESKQIHSHSFYSPFTFVEAAIHGHYFARSRQGFRAILARTVPWTDALLGRQALEVAPLANLQKAKGE